ncbi:GntR family transcriptional regulator [Ancylobacter sp. G4_0304]|uniref:GntR family transcriptional regulator n=1 Tax=Ancylobacter sp. G4_0304 TaxID=3114289 RepID=UPI0039C6286F
MTAVSLDVSTQLAELEGGKRANQSDALFETLTAAIMSGRIGPGEKLNEPGLADAFGVSRAPVREALRRLQEKGLVTHVAHQGVRVISPSLEDFLSLLDVREALEGMASRLAATAMTEPELEELAIIVDQHGAELQRDPDGPYIQNDFDNDFHVRIARGCRNPVLTGLLCEQFYPRLKLCRSRHGRMKGRGLAAWKEHRRILAALTERDGDVAELLMRRHVRSARQALLTSTVSGVRNDEPRAR